MIKTKHAHLDDNYQTKWDKLKDYFDTKNSTELVEKLIDTAYNMEIEVEGE